MNVFEEMTIESKLHNQFQLSWYHSIIELHKKKPWEKFQFFTIYQNYTLAFKIKLLIDD